MKKLHAIALTGLLAATLGLVSCSKNYDSSDAGASAPAEEATASSMDMSEMITQASFKVKGMTCSSCQQKVQASLESIEGVETAEVDLGQGVAKVSCEEGKVTRGEVMKAIEDAGFGSEAI